ncbi:hypothetical protein C8F01DRAFT_441112 [Mycena amicta]|nr:hypothetical protein C8F01DRAFT_441112 [Mycena amicta]
MQTPPHKPYPWPWGHPSILHAEQPTEQFPPDSWLNITEWNEDEDEDFAPSSPHGSDYTGTSAISSTDSDYVEASDEEASDTNSQVSDTDSEMQAILADNRIWLRNDTAEPWEEKREDLPRKIALLVAAEQRAAAVYDPDEVLALITQFYQLLVDMGHWEPDELTYAPHTDPPVDVELALQLGYDEAVVALMQKLPYLRPNVARNENKYLLGRTSFANYTGEHDLREGRRPYPYTYIDGCGDLDPWLLPLMLPWREGWHLILDTKIGVVRAFACDGFYNPENIEFFRHDDPPEDPDNLSWRRVSIVPAAQYFTTLIQAYRSLERLPIINPDRNDPKETRYHRWKDWYAEQDKKQQTTLLQLYKECGWPDQWRRAEFLTKWSTSKHEMDVWARKKMRGEGA